MRSSGTNAARCARRWGSTRSTTSANTRVEGPEAVDWLNRIMANRVPEEGRIALTPMLSPKGKIIGDFTMMRLGPEAGAADRQLLGAELPHALVPATSGTRRNHPECLDRNGLASRSPGPTPARFWRRSTGRRCVQRNAAVPVMSASWRSGISRSPSRGSATPAIWAMRSTATATIRSRSIRRCGGGRQIPRHAAVRDARDDVAAAGKDVLASGCANTGPTIPRQKPGWTASSRGRRTTSSAATRR